MAGTVTLRLLDAGLVERLLHLAVTDASIEDVMPPPGDGVADDDAFREFYGARLGGIDAAPYRTAMFAILLDDQAIGMIRLSRDESVRGRAETGMWLGRSFRSQGYGRSALRALLDVARKHGISEIVADTRPDHVAALAVLRACGATFHEDSSKVYASLPVTTER